MRRGAGLAIASLAFVLLLIASLRWQQAPTFRHDSATHMTVDSGCDSARQACRMSSQDLDLELSFGPSVRPLEPFNVRLRPLRGRLSPAVEIEIRFIMRDMPMGLNQYRLTQSGEAWTARVILPVCTQDRVDWYAQLTIQDAGKQWLAEVPFQTEPLE